MAITTVKVSELSQCEVPADGDQLVLRDLTDGTLKYAEWGDLKTLRWQGAWSSETTYEVNDAVSHNGSSYICILESTDNEPPNETYWTNIAEGVDWSNLAAWNSGTSYKINDLATLNGSLYICTTAHSNQEPPNGSYWSLIAEGLDWTNLAAWDSGTGYKVNDVVTHNSSMYLCVANSSNNEPPNETYWLLMAEGLDYEGAWSSETAYKANSIVTSAGSTYICILAHTNQEPPNATYWEVLAAKGDTGEKGDTGQLTWAGAWSSVTTYDPDEIVENDGTAYVCILQSTNNEPPNATYWEVLAEKGDKGDTGESGGTAKATAQITHDGGATQALFTTPAHCGIVEVGFEVQTEAFDGTVKIGTAADNEYLMKDSEIAKTLNAFSRRTSNKIFTTATDINVYVSGCSTGDGKAYCLYFNL